ncbi:MAG: hypothetical protein ABMA64_20200 [Myxococcota bacterium]
MRSATVVLAGMVLAAGLAGCGGPGNHDDGGQFGEESGARCVVTSRTALSIDEVSPLGFTAQEVVDLTSGARGYSLAYAGGASTPLAFELVPSGVYEYVEQAVVDEGGSGGIEPAFTLFCPNLVAVAAELHFATDDGAFAEVLSVEVSAPELASVSVVDPLDALAGAFDPWDHVPAGSDYDEVEAWLDVHIDAAGVHGTISGQGSGIVGDPDEPDSMAYAESFEVASFGDAIE